MMMMELGQKTTSFLRGAEGEMEPQRSLKQAGASQYPSTDTGVFVLQ